MICFLCRPRFAPNSNVKRYADQPPEWGLTGCQSKIFRWWHTDQVLPLMLANKFRREQLEMNPQNQSD